MWIALEQVEMDCLMILRFCIDITVGMLFFAILLIIHKYAGICTSMEIGMFDTKIGSLNSYRTSISS